MKSCVFIFSLVFLLSSSCVSDNAKNIDVSMKEQLKDEWMQLIAKFTDNEDLIQHSWDQLEQYYTDKNRAYHNLTHINNMLREADKFSDKVADREVMMFAIWFHDIIYDPMSKENELESAKFAKRILNQTTLSKERIENCYQKILLTIKHQPAETAPLDDKLLVDFDLEILSRSWEDYQVYSEQVRKENIGCILNHYLKAGERKRWANF